MKILVFGAGVIGSTYAWQLSEAGYDVSLFVRKQRMVRYSHSGISISCTDLRGKNKTYITTVFRPKTIDRLEPSQSFDLIIVCLKNTQLNDALPNISKFSGNALVLFLGNLWDEFKRIEKHIPTSRCLYGFPAISGGGRTENSINCVLFKHSSTIFGTTNAQSGKQLKDIAEVMRSSGLHPKISRNIKPWIRAHYVVSAASFGVVCKAGSAKEMASSYRLIKQMVYAIREGFSVAKKREVIAWKVLPYVMFYLPSFFITLLLKKSYKEEMLEAIEGQMKHGFDEMKKHYDDILNDGEKYNISMPYWRSFEQYVLKAENNRTIRGLS